MGIQGKGRGWMILRQVTGYACLTIGVMGLLLPILPGIPLLIAGLGLLAVDSAWAARLRDRLKERVDRQISRLHKKADPKPQAVRVPE
jgi:uncharacterized membrane protein YbaN (DUF454 family)